MTRIFLVVIFSLCACPLFLNAQNCGQWQYFGKVGITSSYGVNSIFRSTELDGAQTITGKDFYSFGISYAFELSKALEVEFGLEYLTHSINTSSSLTPDFPTIEQNHNLVLVNLPIALRANFLNFFFVNGGAIVGLDLSATSPIVAQEGIGAFTGIGAVYNFYSGISVFINPYVKLHNLIPFSSSNHQEKLLESGVRLGVTFDLDKIN